MQISNVKTITIALIAALLVCFAATPEAFAKKKSKKSGGLNPAEIQEITQTIDSLTRKVYASSLFSPEENEKLIDVKIKLDNAMLTGGSPELAPLLYKAGNLYRIREYREQAIECFQLVLENFPDTALGPKSKKELKKMGITIQSEEEELEE